MPGNIYDIAVLGHDILNEEYITYGKHFLINNESDINAVITKIEGNIFVNSLTINHKPPPGDKRFYPVGFPTG